MKSHSATDTDKGALRAGIAQCNVITNIYIKLIYRPWSSNFNIKFFNSELIMLLMILPSLSGQHKLKSN